VFFFTRQSFVGQDQDENDDLYDARVEGGIAAQNPTPAASCEGEGCLGPVDSQPVFEAPSSATFTGVDGSVLQPEAKPKALTRKQKLMRALKTCGKKPRRQRDSCEVLARKRYGKRATKNVRGR
jgi:hypothetical protein